MEFPHLGKQCDLETCHRLDFLPFQCDACHKTFCVDHYQYVNHTCPISLTTRDVQVPVCPLCNKPVPVKKGEVPDIRMSAHIDSDCKSELALNNKKIFENRCSLKGCHVKEMVPIKCDSCKKNYCIPHRHPNDHKCKGAEKPADKAREAALKRMGASSRAQAASRPQKSTSMSQQEQDDMQLALALQQSEQEYQNSMRQRSVQSPGEDKKDKCIVS